MADKIFERDEIKLEDKWDIESLYPSIKAWEDDVDRIKELLGKMESHKGKMADSSGNLLETLRLRDEIARLMGNIYVYAHMSIDVDTRVSQSQGLFDKANVLLVQVEESLSFLVPEILESEESLWMGYLEEDDNLKVYAHNLEDILRQKKHILSKREESLIAQMGDVARAPENIYSMLNNADIRFPNIINENGEEVELSQGNFIPFMENSNRDVRKGAFSEFYKTYNSYKNTFAATLSGELKKNLFMANIRNYDSTLEASLSTNNVPKSVYENLLKSIHENLDGMYKYMETRKRVLQLDELHMYDIYTPIVKDVDFKIPYEEGAELIKKALEPLGEDYLKAMNEGFDERWIDKFENRGKRSGAYSTGSYDSKPFILLNYHDTLDNMFTVAHEMGHSLHTYFTKKNQPMVYADYSIFVAEVASTVNELLLLSYMIENTEDETKRAYLINHYLESFRTTVFRQAMFAEFELIINRHLQDGGALTADYLCQEYRKLNELYYGEGVVIDQEIDIEWARIPHFYYNYYVFQYATGFSAAVSLVKRIKEEGKDAVDKYLKFLGSGSSDYPINVLKEAGLDMTSTRPVDDAMKVFRDLVEEFDKTV